MSGMTPPQIVAEIAGSLAIVVEPNSTIELRALPKRGGRSKTPAIGYFRDIYRAAEEAARIDATERYAGVYVLLNPARHELYARCADRIDEFGGSATTDADILRRRWFLVDLDPARPSDISSTELERDLASTRADEISASLSREGFAAPLKASSGNGVHLLYRVDLPNDPASLAAVERFLRRLDRDFSDERVKVDTSVGNAARIVRLYGTVARKGDNIPERPHRRSRLILDAARAEAA